MSDLDVKLTRAVVRDKVSILNGFDISQKLDKEKAKEIKQQLLDIKEQAFDLFIEYNETDNILINEHIDNNYFSL